MRTKLTKEDKATLDALNADYAMEKRQGVTHAWLVDRTDRNIRFGAGSSADELMAIREAIKDGEKAARPKSEKQRLAEFDKMEKELAAAKRQLAEIGTK